MVKTRKQFGIALSIGLNLLLVVLKASVGLMSGSVSVLASAFDSFMDVVSSGLSYAAVYVADSPPDQDHPFGHGKFEDFAGLIEAILIMVGGFFIISEAIHRIQAPEAHEVTPIPGIIVMIISLSLGWIVSKVQFKIATQTESTALEANAHHMRADVIASLGVLISLVLVKLTGIHLFDTAMAIIVAILILTIGYQNIHRVFRHLTDTALPPEEAQQIIQIIHQAMPISEPIKVTDLRTRRAGSHRLIVFNLLVSPQLTIETAHAYCDQIEDALKGTFPNSLVTIHLEPLEKATQKD